VIPAQVDYLRPTSIAEALARRADSGGRFLAGGHSLLPLLKLRQVTTPALVDVSRLAELRQIVEDDDGVVIGASVTYAELVRSAAVGRVAPVLAHAAGTVGDPQVRAYGTIGGSAAQAEPGADMPVVLLCLDARFVMVGPDGERRVHADGFFRGAGRTAIRDGELLARIEVPDAGSARWAYRKFRQRSHEWALVGVAVTETGDRTSIAVNAGPVPVRATAAEQLLRVGGSIDAAAAAAGRQLADPALADHRASAAYRTHLTSVLTERALRDVRAGVPERSG